jgi:hypothetical protein
MQKSQLLKSQLAQAREGKGQANCHFFAFQSFNPGQRLNDWKAMGNI